jgi:hypothetical protein
VQHEHPPEGHRLDAPAGDGPLDLLNSLREAPGQVEQERTLTGNRRWLLLVFAIVPVLAVLAVVALLPSGPDGEPTATTTRPAASTSTAARQEPSAAAAPSPSVSAVGAARQLPPAEASDLLDGAGVDPGGDVAGAWGWSDANGRNLLVTSSAAGSAAGSYDLRVTHVAELDDTARVLRQMREPGVPHCTGGQAGAAGFTPQSVVVRDLDGDGAAEASVGWTYRCGGADARSDVKLTLISNGQKFILRGQGVVGQVGQGGFSPEPAPGSWPELYLSTLTALFHQLYY